MKSSIIASFLALLIATFAIADAVTIKWALGTTQKPITVAANSTIVFQYSGPESKNHDVKLISSAANYKSCSFKGASANVGGGVTCPVGGSSCTFNASSTPGVYYYGCSVPFHCPFGKMKIQITVTSS